MDRRVLIVFVPLLFGRSLVWGETEISAPETGIERQETTSDQEWETRGVIPQGGLTVSTQPITPIALLPERNPYDQALAELAQAQDLWKKGNAEAASDVGLEAYDDLMSFSIHRRTKKKRQKLRLERRQAATVYIDSSIAYIEDFVKKHGEGTKAKAEGRARLGDLRDVSQNYPELNKKLNKALELYAVPAPAPTPTPVPVPLTVTASTSAPAASTATQASH